MRSRKFSVFFVLLFSYFQSTPLLAQSANHVVISEVYGGGGNSGATLKNDFIELYNPTTSPVSLAGWSVQYSSAAGSSWQVTNLSGSIAPHGFYLVQEAQGSGGTISLPTPDATGTLAMSSTAGKVALASSTSALSGSNPTGGALVDLVGYGSTATGYEGTGPAPAPSNTASIERKASSGSTTTSMAPGGADELAGNGYDSDNNASDFVQRASPQPQNSASPVEPFLSPNGSGIGTARISPTVIDAGHSANFSIEVLGDATDTTGNVVVIVPSVLTWSMSSTSVLLGGTGMSDATVAVSADTISISGAAITKTDSAQITIQSVTAPDSAVTANFIVETSVDTVAPAPIAAQLQVSVTKLIRIIDLHINDSQGVPVAPYQVGAVVTIAGVITADFNATRTDVYVQDATAGVNIFSYNRSYNYQVGDSIRITGTIQQYRGTVEILPDSVKTVFYSHGNPLPDPLLLTSADVNQTFTDDYSEPNEGRLVRVNGVTYSSTNETFTDLVGTTGGFIPTGLIVPGGTFDVVGILKQYKPGTAATLTPPYTGDYEVEARTQDDIITHGGPTFVEVPSEKNIAPNSVDIYFKTALPSSGVVRFGKTASYSDSVVVSTADTLHTITLGGLWPATVYHYQAAATDGTGTNQTGDAIFSTGSPAGSTAVVNVYFSKSVDTTVASGEKAQTVDISSKFIARINAAQYSIDVALYSLSGTVGNNVASALINAKNRGVKVRMIVENDNSNTSPMNTMKSSGIPFITDTFDPINAGNGLMHNKFAVFDLRDTSSFTDDWVWTGSWNATDPGNNSDAQNSLEIQDKSLANAYTMEFNEMWGSSTDTPDASQSRFGIRKTDNTPHHFNIGGIPVDLYFSPSDQTTLHIYETLELATSSINVCMLTFTRSDLAQLLIAKKAAGDKVRVVMDNNTDSGNQFSALGAGNVDVHLKGSSLSGLLHHKYALVDAENPKADEIVITGSHNWSNSAETSNNENTLMIHSNRIANLYLQEFKARYIEAGGTDNIILGLTGNGNTLPKEYALSQNYPNPFNPSTAISYQLSAVSFVTLKVYDILGREVAALVNGSQVAGTHLITFDGSRFASGVYFYRLSARSLSYGNQHFTETKKLVLLK
ncbi:MAG TPA: phospholipase D-like domain-containing protein [Candidatus Kryptonia bacterium]